MIDKSKRQGLEQYFNFDRFHEVFSQLLSVAKEVEPFTLQKFIEETDNLDFWNDYNLEVSRKVAQVLVFEVYEEYDLYPDANDEYHIEYKEEVAPVRTELSIRDLAKEFLESSSEPKSIEDILEYVNEHRSVPVKSAHSLRTSLIQADGIFVAFPDKRIGLSSVSYPEAITHKNELAFTELKSQKFELRYSTKRLHQPVEFFTSALSNSSSLDLGLGYFSSACFNVLACGFAHFIKNGGNMRMYINPNLTEDDYNLLKNNDEDEFKQRLIDSYDKLFNILSRRDELFFRCLSYLIQQKRIDIRIAVLNEGGIAHEKFGIFTDSFGDEVAFNGSMNLTASGLTRNIESIDCTCSWHNEENKERIDSYHHDFEGIWNGTNKDVTLFSSEDFCNTIVQRYPSEKLDDLIVEETETIRDLEVRKDLISPDDPHFPSKFPGAFPYQVEAYNSWCMNGKTGIFAMATGTGKTITSLNCALEEFYADGFYRLLILVPSLALVEQWEQEASNFNYRNIIMVSSENSLWRSELLSIIRKIERGKSVNFVIISTYNSFVIKDFQALLPNLSAGTILIADEAHNIGSSSVREAFRRLTIERRIALSATPQRVYDEVGTKEIETFFNDTFPYVYSFSMKKAIEMERLMNYYYHPRVAFLDEDEMSKYAFYTRQLLQMYSEESGSFSDPERAQQLLMSRKNILHKARNKMNLYREIIEEIGEDKLRYCFVYSAAGKRYDQRPDENDQYDTEIIKEMLAVTKEVYPSIRCNSYTSNDSKEARRQKLDAFAQGHIDILFAKNCLDEGVDVPRAEYGIFTSSTGNPRQFIQRRGRLIRRHPDKKFAYIYDMVVSPNFHSPQYDRKWWSMEKHLVEGEMRRVANFACLASNYYTGALCALSELLFFYEIDIDGMVLNEENE